MASPRVRAVLEMMSEMTAEERDELRDELEVSSEEWASAWSAELERRMAQIERGEVKLLTRERVQFLHRRFCQHSFSPFFSGSNRAHARSRA
jgi:hypothetical protein